LRKDKRGNYEKNQGRLQKKGEKTLLGLPKLWGKRERLKGKK
jgi:hypothetical protein